MQRVGYLPTARDIIKRARELANTSYLRVPETVMGNTLWNLRRSVYKNRSQMSPLAMSIYPGTLTFWQLPGHFNKLGTLNYQAI